MSIKRLHAYLLLLIVSIIWGIAGSVIKFTQEGIATLPFLIYRFAISSVVALVALVFIRPKLPKNLFDIFQLVVYGVLASAVALGVLFFGLERTSVVEMNLLSATAPLVTAIMGVKYLKEHVTKKEKLGLTIAFLGTLFVIFEPISFQNDYKDHILGNLAIFAYVTVTAISYVIAKKLLRKGYSPALLTHTSFVFGFLVIAVFAISQTGTANIVSSVIHLEFKYHLGVLYMALFSGTLAYYLETKAQKTIEIGETAVFAYLVPVFGIPTAIFWLKEMVTLQFIIGAIIIAIGVFIAEIKKKRYNQSS